MSDEFDDVAPVSRRVGRFLLAPTMIATYPWLPDRKDHFVLSDAEKAHLEKAIYPHALAEAGEPNTSRNRLIAASDYCQFLQLGGGTDADATAAIVRGLRACDAG